MRNLNQSQYSQFGRREHLRQSESSAHSFHFTHCDDQTRSDPNSTASFQYEQQNSYIDDTDNSIALFLRKRNELEKKCCENYTQRIKEIKKDIKMCGTSPKEKEILQNHLYIMNRQQDTFKERISKISLKLTSIVSAQNFVPELSALPSFEQYCKEIYREVECESYLFKEQVPIYAYKNDILSSYANNKVTIISADAGYFASEVVPLFICDKYNNIISCVQNSSGAILSAEVCKTYCIGSEAVNITCLDAKVCDKQEESTEDQLHLPKISFISLSELCTNCMTDSYFAEYSTIILQCHLLRNKQMVFVLHYLKSCIQENQNFKLILVISPQDDICKFKSYFKFTTVDIIMTPDIVFPIHTVFKKHKTTDVDYITETVNTALAVHATLTEHNQPGDVLIFLPSHLYLKKVSVLLNLRFKEYKYHKKIQCIHLFDKPDISLCAKFLTKSTGVRNYFLAEGHAEFLPLKSVFCVIDLGICPNLCFPENCFNKSEFTFVSRKRAKLREYCAGRNSAGLCYRIYSKLDYKQMNESELPEILCMNPLKVIVSMFQYGMKDTSIEFFDSLPKDIREKSLYILENANIIENNEIATWCDEVLKLPYFPRYSKLLFAGIQQGYAIEAIIFIAIFTIKKSLFCCSEDKDVCHKVNTIKYEWFLFDSDTINNLEIYRKWEENNFQKQWCEEHALNYDVLVEVQEKVDDIKKLVSEHFNEWNIDLKIKSQKKDDRNALQSMLFDCLNYNLCVNAGHPQLGYYILNDSNYRVFIHPTSFLLQKEEQLPEFVVYEHLQQIASEFFMVGVTSIPENIVKHYKNGIFADKVEELLSNKLEGVIIKESISLVKQIFLSANVKKKSEIETEIKTETNCDLIVIELSEEKGYITLYAPPDYISKAKEILCDILQKQKSNEEEIVNLNIEKDDFKVPVALTVTKGAVVTGVNLCLEPMAVQLYAGQEQNDCNDESNCKYFIDLKIVRRKCIGSGYVSFGSRSGDFKIACQLFLFPSRTLEINGQDADIKSKYSTNELHFEGLPETTTDDDLKKAVNVVLQNGNYAVFCRKEPIEAESISVLFSDSYETTEGELEEIQNQIYDACHSIFNKTDISITLTKPENNDAFFRAKIYTNVHDKLEENAELLSNDLKVNGLPVKAEAIYCSAVTCNIKVFEALKESIDLEFKEHQENKLLKLDIEFKSNELVNLKFSTKNQKLLNSSLMIINKMLGGEIMTSYFFPNLHRVFTSEGHLWLRLLEGQLGIYVIDEYKSNILRIYGTRDKCEAAFENIKTFLIKADKEYVLEIELPRITLKAAVREYGVELKKFVEDFKLTSAKVNIKEAKLVLHGDKDYVLKAYEPCIKKLSDLSTLDKDEITERREQCIACFDSFAVSSIRLDQCGHLYCLECIRHNIVVNIKEPSPSFPLICCAEGCNEMMVLQDIRRALDYDNEEINYMLHKALNHFISKSDRYCACPAPGCPMFCDRSDALEVYRCKLCQNDVCLNCRVLYHHGVSCDMFQGTENDPNYPVKVYLEENEKKCKKCPNPKCGTAIEKNEGCFHMQCTMCKEHFCWYCLKIYPTVEELLNHQPDCNAPRD